MAKRKTVDELMDGIEQAVVGQPEPEPDQEAASEVPAEAQAAVQEDQELEEAVEERQTMPAGTPRKVAPPAPIGLARDPNDFTSLNVCGKTVQVPKPKKA